MLKALVKKASLAIVLISCGTTISSANDIGFAKLAFNPSNSISMVAMPMATAGIISIQSAKLYDDLTSLVDIAFGNQLEDPTVSISLYSDEQSLVHKEASLAEVVGIAAAYRSDQGVYYDLLDKFADGRPNFAPNANVQLVDGRPNFDISKQVLAIQMSQATLDKAEFSTVFIN